MTRKLPRGVPLLLALVSTPFFYGCSGDDENRIVGEDQAEFVKYAEQAAAESQFEEDSPEEEE